MRPGRSWVATLRSERGEITLVGAIIAVLIGAAAAATTIAVVKRSDGNTQPEAILVVNSFSGSRDANDLPVITLEYTAAFGEVFELRGKQLNAEVHCAAQEQVAQPRIFNGDTTFTVLSGTRHDGVITISPGPANKDLNGTVRVRCELWRNGVRVAAKTVDLNVPAPRDSGGQPPGLDLDRYAGAYDATFTLVTGISSNCDASVRRMRLTVKVIGDARISVELTGQEALLGISSFATDVSPTLQFSGTLLLEPGNAEWSGLLTGGFATVSRAPTISGRFTRDDGHCIYDFVATQPSATSSAVAVSLEQIPGVDGCRPRLDRQSVASGTITFRATNNTFGFAQAFIHDNNGTLVGHHDEDIPERGGTIEFTARLAKGSYDVSCDGPGGLDEKVTLVVD